jgi:Secretion system C-terminal sorting domain
VKRILTTGTILFLNIILHAFCAIGQEFEGPITFNPFLSNNHHAPLPRAKKTATALTLPFFEDFTAYTPYPDSNKWTDFEVFINNTMGANVISRGVATFDALNSHGIPYDSFSNARFGYADSLTSRPIDISAYSAADSVYLSFFYQPQGNSFYPLPKDSLMLFFKNRYGDFVKVWSVPGSTLQPFQQVMIPITDTLYFHSSFQFRFINIAALYWADAIWNVDYIRLDKNRSMTDTAVTDVAFTSNPSFLLNDLTFMPYSQFMANHTGESVGFISDSIRNTTSGTQVVDYGVEVRNVQSGAILSAIGTNTVTLPGFQADVVAEPFTVGTFPTYPADASVVFETKYYLTTATPAGPTVNDTIIKDQVFDNYLAYDDGTAEKSYYLNLLPSLPGKIAIEYHLNKPDSLRGMAIYFGRQIPFANYKSFAIYVYSSITGVNGATHDIILDSTYLVDPAYADSVNKFWIYTFRHPVLVPAGTFYAGTQQPAGGSSDSLYFGLDVNRIGPNHAWYNVTGNWVPSSISGAIMMRPIFGKAISGSSVKDVTEKKDEWQAMPNPVTDVLKFEFTGSEVTTYRLTDIQGHTLMNGNIHNGSVINIRHLAPGMYFVNITRDGIPESPKKIIKL